MVVLKELYGHSGCGVSLIKSNNMYKENLFVRKVSKDQEYNPRLEKQFFKQNGFNHPDIKSPRIYSSGFCGDLFYFDMEYIEGRPLHDFIASNHPNDSIKILKTIFNIYKSTSYPVVDKLIKAKLKSLSSTVENKTLLRYCVDFDWSHMSVSNCHGDLSLENIIIKNNQIYLIDFLDSFVDSQFIDISKVFADLMFGWSWRYQDSFPFVKNAIILNYFQNFLSSRDKEIYNRLIPLQLMRILNYCNDGVSEDLLGQSLFHLKGRL